MQETEHALDAFISCRWGLKRLPLNLFLLACQTCRSINFLVTVLNSHKTVITEKATVKGMEYKLSHL